MRKRLTIIDNFLITLLTMIMVAVFVVFPLSFSFFSSSASLQERYSLMDLFSSMQVSLPENQPYYESETDIIIVDLSEVQPRSDVFQIMKSIMEANPKLVGFDIWLAESHHTPEDSLFAALLLEDSRIISPCKMELQEAPGSASFQAISYPFYANEQAPLTAATNLDLFESDWNCKTFTPILFHEGNAIETFAVAMARHWEPTAYNRLMRRPTESHYIHFSRSRYTDISGKLILEAGGPWLQPLLENKLVLVGDINDTSDFFATPLSAQTAGVEVHANILATILSSSWPIVMPRFWAWVLAFLGILILLPLLRWVKKNEWLSIFLPLFQAILIVLFVFLCYWIFIHFNFYINSTYLLLGIGFMEVAEALYLKLYNSVKR